MDNLITYRLFVLGDKIFAANIRRVLTVMKLNKITKTSNTPSYLRGFFLYQGIVLPLIDLRLKFGFTVIEKTDFFNILVVSINIGNEIIQIGVLVDIILDETILLQQNITLVTSIVQTAYSKFLSGIYTGSNGTDILIIDVDKVFSLNAFFDVDELN
jgi:purine-binding chemotaxis protein CheW